MIPDSNSWKERDMGCTVFGRPCSGMFPKNRGNSVVMSEKRTFQQSSRLKYIEIMIFENCSEYATRIQLDRTFWRYKILNLKNNKWKLIWQWFIFKSIISNTKLKQYHLFQILLDRGIKLTWAFIPNTRVINLGTREAKHENNNWGMQMIDGCSLKLCVATFSP